MFIDSRSRAKTLTEFKNNHLERLFLEEEKCLQHVWPAAADSSLCSP